MSLYVNRDVLAASSSSPDGTGPAGAGRDRDGFAAILTLLRDCGGFAAVNFPRPPERSALGSDAGPIAMLVPGGWSESDDRSPSTLIRSVDYGLIIEVRDESCASAYDAADRLACLAQNLLDNRPIGGFCLPGLTTLRRGRVDASSRPPLLRLALEGRFAYVVARPSGRSTAP